MVVYVFQKNTLIIELLYNGNACVKDHIWFTSLNAWAMPNKYTNIKLLLLWCYIKGHEWKTRLGHIREVHWCLYCVDNAKLTLEDAKHVVFIKNGECLSEIYINSYCEAILIIQTTQERIVRRNLDCFKVYLILRKPIYSYSKVSLKIGSH
ncbi:hypothetical protein Glove_718g8 [Diversispora epigaea]|uniref:Uncharacterized protein n=1 Tax=Diversispora epigaea TaxID=1348612 RepID=A0A397G3C5_9GLOM|nr:hypothetical protein Glove_718g8 [Diversispora epigaea]